MGALSQADALGGTMSIPFTKQSDGTYLSKNSYHWDYQNTTLSSHISLLNTGWAHMSVKFKQIMAKNCKEERSSEDPNYFYVKCEAR